MWARWSLLATFVVASLLVAPAGLAAPDPAGPLTPEEARARAPSPRIFGGTEVSPEGKYPFMVSLHGPGHFCGGSLVNADWVLTAAHCVTDFNGNENWAPTDTVVIDRHDLSTGDGEEIAFLDVVVHPLWDGEGLSSGSATRPFDYDVALIELATSASLGGPVTFSGPGDEGDWDPGEPGTVMGWGETETGPTDVLLQVDIPFVSDPGCDAAWGMFFVEGLIVCAGGVSGEDSCTGDSGGPLVAPPGASGWKQVALVSGGGACGSTTPAFYAFLPNLRSFVEATVGTNAAPVADADSVTTPASTPVVISVEADLLAGDTDDHDLELLPIHVTVDDSGLAGGSLTDNGDGTYTYDPDPGFSGTDAFTYTVHDSAPATSNVATVTIDVTNDPPVANDDGGASYTTDEDTPFTTGDVVANDTDTEDGIPAGPVSVVTGPSDGDLTDNGDGTFDYDPDPDFNGTDTFTYTVDDSAGATSNAATVTITVTAVNDPPVANDDGGAAFTTTEDTPFTTGDVTANDTDVEDGAPDPTTAAVGSFPSDGTLLNNGDGTFDYDPDPDFNGTDTFTYLVNDSQGGLSNLATVTITVTPVNDPPTAADQSPTVAEDGFVPITLQGTDPDDDPLTFTVTAGPSDGSLTGTPPNVTYSPDPDYHGPDSFDFEVDDGNGGTDTGTVSITVLSVNDPPVIGLAGDQAVLEDAPAQTVPGFMTPAPPDPVEPGQSITDFDVANDQPGLFAVEPAIDEGTGELTYTPAPDANGVATVSVTAVDSGPPENGGDDTTVETFTITLDAVNDAPSFTVGPDVEVEEDSGAQSFAGWATAISPGPPNESGQVVTFAVIGNTNPALFSTQPLVAPDGTLTFTPAGDSTGSSTISVRAKDDFGTPNGGSDTSAPQDFVITVTPANDPPVAVGDTATVGDGDTVDIAVLANDSDPEGSPLTPVIASPPAAGTATVVGTSIRYVHDGSGAGTDSLTYRASDGAATSNVVTVTITITDDGDGVPASVEDGAPNDGDGNDDGIPDRRQGGVTSLPNAVDGSYVTLASGSAAALSGVTAIERPAETPPPLLEFPVGFFSFGLAPVPPGGLAIVDMILHGDPEIDTFYKFGPTEAQPDDDGYYEFLFEDDAGAELLPGMVRLHLVDGIDGDADLVANGVISDPGAPARTIDDTTPPPPPPPPPASGELIGLVDPSTGTWHLRRANATVLAFFYGNPGDVPFMGDWDCDGIDTPGLFRQSDAFVYLRNSNSQGIADVRYFFGDPADVPVAGDFDGDGCDTVSLYRPSEQRFYIINKLGSGDRGVGAADWFFTFGDPGDQPVGGDWDGDGVTEVGLHRASTGFFYWRNTLDTGVASGEIFFGDPGDRFVAGDWGVEDGRDTPAVFRPAASAFFLRFTLTQGNADAQFQFGEPAWLPVAGQFFR